MTPRPVQHGGRVVCAADPPLHRALAGPSNPAGSGRRQRVAVVCWRKQIRRLQRTPTLPPCWTGRGVIWGRLLAQTKPAQRAGDAHCRRDCLGRLMPGATVRPFLKQNEGRLGLALQCPQRSQFHPRAVGKLHRVTIRRELRHFDQIIKLEHGGTDRRQKTNDLGVRPIGPHNSLDLTCVGVARAVKIEVAREDLREAITYQKSTTSRPVSAAPRTSIDQSPASRPKRRSAALLARITGVLSALRGEAR